jgi:TIR domain-containing protein
VDPEIFITHSSKDQKVARTICTALENRGLACWISSRDVKPGQNFQEQIVKAIRAAKIMVLVFTANANNSNEVKKELALASQNDLIVIPVRIEDVAPNEAFTYEFATRQWIDLFDNWENSMARLVELIASTLNDHPAQNPKAGSGLTVDAGVTRGGPKAARGIAVAAGRGRPPWVLSAGIAAACVVVLFVGAFAYLKIGRTSPPPVASQTVPAPVGPPQPAPRQAEALVPETIPIIADRARENIRKDYMLAADHKALAISNGPIGYITAQPDDEAAKTAALDLCKQRADALPAHPRCEIYAVGTTVVYARGRPPMPRTPWVSRDPSIEKPLVTKDIPLLPDNYKAIIEKTFVPGHRSKALAISPSGYFTDYFNQDSTDEAMRRALEVCGSNTGVPCMIVAVDDNFVVPIPSTMKVVGFFRATAAASVAPELRKDLEHRLTNSGGWTAVATGDDGKVGLMANAADEQAAVDGAIADCVRQDRSCRVIAIGQFAVEPK